MSHPTTLLAPSQHQHRAPAGAEPAPGAAADWTVPQHWDELTDEDHWVWDTLFARQKTLLHDKVVGAFEEGLDILDLSRPGVPNFDELNVRLGERTGWKVVAVPGLIPDSVFFDPADPETVVYAILILGCSAYAGVSILLLPRKKER